jgi:hypothetical protein
MQCRGCDALTDSCWIALAQISVCIKVISSVPCVYFSSFTSVVHCSFRLRHFLKKLRDRLLVSSYRSVCPSVRPHVSTRLTTDGHSQKCMSVHFSNIRHPFQVLLKSDKKNRNFACRNTYIYDVTSAGSAVSDQSVA